MSAESFTQQNLEWLIKITDRGETRIAEMVGPPITRPKLSKAVNGKRHLTRTEARAIELHFGIPNRWLHDYPIQKAWRPLIIELQKMSPEVRTVIDSLLKFASDNASS